MNEPLDLLLEQHHRTIATITDVLTGATTPALLSAETVTVDPRTGAKTYTITTAHLRTADGRSVKPDAISLCRSCNASISETASRACVDCTVTLCAGCAGKPARCTPCRRRDLLRRFWKWLTTLS
jgi:hypothetical protein